MVCHKPDIEPYAEITFYNERDFLQEVIAPYYDALNLGTPPLINLLKVLYPIKARLGLSKKRRLSI
ncbi:hypothetical protein PN36_16160 [Candidatus Thiomargarita nelsonii]|uniref:Uncharacterized protein n=1 Tax=Candidatus Thiomargarita nelsonii TaxID=1003181 RepID=A0A4E0QXM1_9GAMM|nr:hypothetical protein PN36_28960 [Candidatus Thiomargarita nelsonii]TGO02919.1 hypothetical protein PN36_16160 [Candidatus Thiomargarita nelsonii]